MDVEASAYGMYFLECASRFAQENADEGPLLTLLYYALRALTNQRIPKRLVMRIFEMKTLTLEGFAPEFQEGDDFSGRLGLELPPEYADALYYALVLEMSSAEIARLLGIQPAAARKRVSRGRQLLRKRLGKEYTG